MNADGEFDPSALKKKKKKAKKAADTEEDFDAKLAEAGVEDEIPAEETVEEQAGDLERGTGICQSSHQYNSATRYTNICQGHHDAAQPINYVSTSRYIKRYFED